MSAHPSLAAYAIALHAIEKALKQDNIREGFFEHEEFLAVQEVVPGHLKAVTTFAYLTGWRKDSEWLQKQLQCPHFARSQEGRPAIIHYITGKFIDLLDRGEFGPRSSLGADKLLQNLVAYMLGKAADSPREPSLPFPPGATRYHGVRWQIRELPVHQCCQGGLDASEHVIGNDPVAGTILTATPRKTPVTFTGRQLFNAFVALELRWMLRSSQSRSVRRLTDWEFKGCLQAGQLKPDPAGSLQLSAYPSQQDRQKIQAFLAEYGPRFLPGTLSSVPSQVYRNPRGDGTTVTLIPPGSPDDPLDFFSEFAQQYHFFKWTEMILMRRLFPGPSPIDASGDLWELAIAVLRCALPTCGNTFFPLRKDQTCCGPAHAGRLRVQHSRRKHARQ